MWAPEPAPLRNGWLWQTSAAALTTTTECWRSRLLWTAAPSTGWKRLGQKWANRYRNSRVEVSVYETNIFMCKNKAESLQSQIRTKWWKHILVLQSILKTLKEWRCYNFGTFALFVAIKGIIPLKIHFLSNSGCKHKKVSTLKFVCQNFFYFLRLVRSKRKPKSYLFQKLFRKPRKADAVHRITTRGLWEKQVNPNIFLSLNVPFLN